MSTNSTEVIVGGAVLAGAAQAARDLEAAGYSGAWTAETAHDPFLPLLLGAEHTTDIELGTSIAVAVVDMGRCYPGGRDRRTAGRPIPRFQAAPLPLRW